MTELSLAELRARTSRKWRTHPADVLPLWIAEMDVRLAEPISAAVHSAIDRGDTGYSHPGALAEAVGAFAATRWGWVLDPDHTAQMPDVMRGIVELLGLITDPGDSVIVTTPVYPPFLAFPARAGRHVAQVRLGEDGRLDFAALTRAFAAETRGGRRAALLLCNPHNPTGAVHSRAELAAVLQLAEHYGVRVVADEIHSPLVLAGAVFTPLLTVPGSDRAFSILSASKGWNLAGLKAAIAVAGRGAVSELRSLPESVGLGASHLGVIAQTAAFIEGGSWLDRLLAALDAARTELTSGLAELLPELRCTSPESTFLAWIDCRALVGRGIDTPPAEFFLDHARVAVNPGTAFGHGGEHHVRLNFATHPGILRAALLRLRTSLLE